MQFKPGDQVFLKSGSPMMTVRWVVGEEVYCEWFDSGAIKGYKFHPSQLQPA